MRKKLFGLMLAALAVTAFAVFAVGCTPPNAATAEYSVTVLSPENAALEGVTVHWSDKGSAVTDANGKAATELPLGTYAIELDTSEEYTYTSVSVGSSLRDVTLTLEYRQVEYTATVLDRNGAAAQDVTVVWMKDDVSVGTKKTDENGKASITLNYGDYDVTVSDLPDGNIYGGDSKKASGKNPSATFELSAGSTVRYTIKVRSEGQLAFKDCQVNIYKADGSLYVIGRTNDDGIYSVSVEAGSYTATAPRVNDGYRSGTAVLSESVTSADIVLTSSVITSAPPAGTRYRMGDIIHDYTFTTPYNVDGSPITVSIADLINNKKKKAVLINNWGTQCSNCLAEMPAMEEAYAQYKDDIEIIAVSNYPSRTGYDSDNTIIDYYNRYRYSFPMMRDSTAGFGQKFGIEGWPTTVVIDRYGAVARIEVGAVTDSDIWGRLIQKYVGDDYVQTFVPGSESSDSITNEVQRPDVTVPADHYEKIGELLNKFPQDSGASVTWFPETEYEYAWPFVIGTVEENGISPDEQVVYASGTKHANSMTVLYATVDVQAGKVFTFDYYCDTEPNNDILNVLWDGKILQKISGTGKGWQTCKLIADITSGKHSFAFVYVKDESRDIGTDNVYIKNVRFTELDEITEDTNMLRAAAYGTPAEGAAEYPYYAPVAIGNDGYYHVNKSGLQNSAFAGNDESPMLFINLLNVTNWAGYSVYTLVTGVDEAGNRIDMTFDVNGVTKDYRDELLDYATLASKSDLSGYLPVDKELHDLMVAFTAHLSGQSSHDNEWLELCYFYSHYGAGDPIGNPIIGLTEKTAVEISADGIAAANEKVTVTAELTRNIYPFPYAVYSFTPEVSGVYRMHSLIPDEQAGEYMSQIWLYDDVTSMDSPLAYCGDDYYTRTSDDEHNFDLYRYMTAGKKYYMSVAFQMAMRGEALPFDIILVGDSETVLTPASAQHYTFETDKDGNLTNKLILANAVSYAKDDQGYYRVKNADGSLGSYIYLDVRYYVMGTLKTLNDLVDAYEQDPATSKPLSYKKFDFGKRVVYWQVTDENGDTVYNYDPDYDMTRFNEEGKDPVYKDYTDRLKYIIEHEGDENGFVKADDEIVKILTMYFLMRNNDAYLDEDNNVVMEEPMPNEWLRFCWYYKTYDANS